MRLRKGIDCCSQSARLTSAGWSHQRHDCLLPILQGNGELLALLAPPNETPVMAEWPVGNYKWCEEVLWSEPRTGRWLTQKSETLPRKVGINQAAFYIYWQFAQFLREIVLIPYVPAVVFLHLAAR
ncbi:hypothetical protein D3C76_1425470 [compost metagenome]